MMTRETKRAEEMGQNKDSAKCVRSVLLGACLGTAICRHVAGYFRTMFV